MLIIKKDIGVDLLKANRVFTSLSSVKMLKTDSAKNNQPFLRKKKNRSHFPGIKIK